ncbi:amidohydrolase [Lysinibacillus endophyticus]|uniref:Amidohydrolase n=1 Tax=Ureibacillus endophyticus TaxID=1978490 RepID=A0A494YW54_9BACL|nr:amidohydrolase [Lysinibacillus endophyticus]MCP1143561.1 amidohydrolase [Lysinibacillus endophyticus]RKQ14335.1 amidohydrolase [Lysinibacillus endophyticus]
MNDLFSALNKNYEEMVSIRRHLHENPELSFEEVLTPKFIADYHRKLGLEAREGVGGRGVVATLKGAKPGRTVALRADFDALAIQELNEVPYKSKVDGVMHACGHDGHTATLLVLAKVLNEMRSDLTGNVVFIHQFAEEITPGGAKPMIEDGCLDGVDVIFGTHLWAPTPLGDILVRNGPIMAAADMFEITIHGKGGHGAEPHNSVDSIVIGSQFITQLQTLVSRRVDPLKSAVVSVGHFEAINPFNVIAEKVVIKGTVRTFEESVRTLLEKEIELLLKTLCEGAHARFEYKFSRGYPPVVNHKKETQFIADIACSVPEVTSVKECAPFMIGEDFAYYLEKVPGTFFITGAKNPSWETAYPHHHARFDFDERAMLIAAKTMGMATLKYLKHSK